MRLRFRFCVSGWKSASRVRLLVLSGALTLSGLVTPAALAQSTDPQNNNPQSNNPQNSGAPHEIKLLEPDTPGGSHAALDLRDLGPSSDSWLYPVTKLDESLPRWLQFGGQFRDRIEAQDGIKYAPVSDTYDLTQLRLGIYIQPTRWLKLVGVTQDSRVFFNQHVGSVPPYQNRWDIREAYLELGDTTEGWYDFIVGREILSFGDERVIGPSDWLNMGRTFDTLRVDLHEQSWKTSIFAASVINAVDGQLDHHIEGNNLYGFYNSFTHIVPHATFEPYLLWRIAPRYVKLAENAGLGHFDEVTGGGRLAGRVGEKLDYDVEMNKQTGSLANRTIDAWGGHWNGGYTITRTHVLPRLFAEYNYASGNKNPAGSTWSTHDQLYPSAHDKIDLADQFGWKNIKDFRTGMNEKIGERWKLTQSFAEIGLASKYDGVYGTNGALAITAHPNVTSTHIGEELDAVGEFKQNRHLTYGLGLGHIFPGPYLNQTTKGKDYTYPFTYATYVF